MLRYGLPVTYLLVVLTSHALAQEEAVWTKTRVVPAPEAVQAAAADDRFLYAVTNDRVAKYDRTTGERVAVSTGEAEHLNSGFFWKGKLYCAHSNYPKTPERSEIMVLDPGTMRLTTFRDFGNFGGSLTWAIRHNDRWWCNFARYGKENAGTFLVAFDNDWQELGRWTYPPELIAQLGTYSLSGGIWHGEKLLVTDHDHGRLYVLELPSEGSVMKYAGRESVPFTGQGIAADPQTGGLVGIDRARREIVLAAPP